MLSNFLQMFTRDHSSFEKKFLKTWKIICGKGKGLGTDIFSKNIYFTQ